MHRAARERKNLLSIGGDLHQDQTQEVLEQQMQMSFTEKCDYFSKTSVNHSFNESYQHDSVNEMGASLNWLIFIFYKRKKGKEKKKKERKLLFREEKVFK